MAGSTNAALLRDRGVHIWDGNGSRAYLDRWASSRHCAHAQLDDGPDDRLVEEGCRLVMGVLTVFNTGNTPFARRHSQQTSVAVFRLS